MIKTLKIFTCLLTLFIAVNSCGSDKTPPPSDVGFIEDPTTTKIPFEDLLDLVQEQTFNYFWDFAEPLSGMAKERSQAPGTITIGGSGFGVSCFPAAVIEVGYLKQQQLTD